MQLTCDKNKSSLEEANNILGEDIVTNSKFIKKNASELTIKELLKLSLSQSKEAKILLGTMENLSIVEIYNRILQLKLSNKDFLYFLNIMNEYPRDINLENLIKLKFGSMDKYTNSVMIAYFNLCGKYFSSLNSLTYDQKVQIFVRYLYVFENDISKDIHLYFIFRDALYTDFLDSFIFNKCYKKFYFLKEFIVDFSDKIGENLIKIGYDCPEYRRLIYSICPNVWTVCWLEQTKLSKIFYAFDYKYFMHDLAEEKFERIRDLLTEISGEIGNIKTEGCNCNADNFEFCFIHPSNLIQKYSEIIYSKIIELKKEKEQFTKNIFEFNKTGKNLPDDLSKLRLCKIVSLKTLGEFLCKEKNKQILIEFTKTFNFYKLDILDSLREYLSSFQLQGESQIIDRVITIFVKEYIKQNNLNVYKNLENNDDSLFNAYYKVSYSFIFLNTMLHNPSIEKKMTFEDYFKKTENIFIEKDTLKKYYENIKENELKIPLEWEDGFDKYQLYNKIIQEDFINESNNEDLNEIVDKKLSLNNSYKDNELNIIIVNNKELNSYQLNCAHALAAYKYLFLKHHDSFVFADPEEFFKICNLFSNSSIYEKYLNFHKNNLSKSILAYKFYIEKYLLNEIHAKNIQGFLEKIEKPKGSIIKSMFGNKQKSQILSTFTLVYNEFISIKFDNLNTLIENMIVLYEISSPFTKSIYSIIILNNFDLFDFNNYESKIEKLTKMLDEETMFILVNRNNKFLQFLNNLNKSKYFQYSFKTNFSDELYNIFMNSEFYLNSSLQTYCLGSLNRNSDDFEKIVKIDNSENILKFTEIYKNDLKNVNSTLFFFKSQNSSIFNCKIAKRIHKDSCPLKSEIFTNYFKLIYLLSKAVTMNDDSINNYTLLLLNYLSDSLILYCLIIQNAIKYEVYLNEEKVEIGLEIFIKVLKSRLKKSKIICCKEFEEEYYLNSDYNKSDEYINKMKKEELEEFITNLYKQGYLDKEDILNFKEEIEEKSEIQSVFEL